MMICPTVGVKRESHGGRKTRIIPFQTLCRVWCLLILVYDVVEGS